MIHGSSVIRQPVTFEGPVYTQRDVCIGPDVTVGRFTGFSGACYARNCKIGSFGSFGWATVFNPVDHPLDWVTTHGFPYETTVFPEDQDYVMLPRTLEDPCIPYPAITIGHDVWTGRNAIIMADVGIGAVVGAGAIVTKPVAPYAIVAGNPARLIRYRFKPDTCAALLESKWWERPLKELLQMPLNNVLAFLKEVNNG